LQAVAKHFAGKTDGIGEGEFSRGLREVLRGFKWSQSRAAFAEPIG
jgi:hypothetical protein